MPEVEMTPDERKKVEELKEKLKTDLNENQYNDDLMLYRFLKARSFNLDSATLMLKKHLQWRKEKNIEEFVKSYSPPEVFKKYLGISLIGCDKEGCLVRYTPVGKLDVKGVAMCCKASDFDNLFITTHELDLKLSKEKSEKLGRNIYQTVFIYDFEGMTFAKATDRQVIEISIFMCISFLNNYPECMKAAYVINSSMYFNVLFSVVKRFLPSTIMSKIHIFGTDGWKEALLEVIDADELPAFLGGNRTDPDGNPLCNSFINHGGQVPEKFYLRKSKRSLCGLPGVKNITLSRASFHEELIEVKEDHSLIEWEFETKSRDIGFGLFLQDKSSEEEHIVEIVPIQRIHTDEYSESGVYKCEKAGTYVILFDNSYSWIRSKEIFFKTAVIKPDELAQQFNHDISPTENGH